MNFNTVARVLNIVANTSSTLSKVSILTRFNEVEGLKEVLRFIYDPNIVTGIGKKNLYANYSFPDMQEITPEEIMEFLLVENTGSSYAAAKCAAFCQQYADNGTALWLAEGLVQKNLQIGVSVTTLKKIFGNGFIPTIGIMRGMLCPDTLSGLYIATEKIDGNRRLIMTKPRGTEIYTRSGKRDYGLVEIEEQAKQLPGGYVFDTECVAAGEFEDSIALRQASASILNSKGKRTGVKAMCFDMIPQREYDCGISAQPAIIRKASLAGLFGQVDSFEKLTRLAQKHDSTKPLSHLANSVNAVNAQYRQYSTAKLSAITALPILDIVSSKQQALDIAAPIWETGGEGIMLVEYLSKYEVNPNPRKTLLKIKATAEYKLLCVGVHEGENKYEGMLGAIEVIYTRPNDSTNYRVKIGSGFPDYLREEYWDDPDKIIGKFVEIESFGESRNAQGMYSLNCPIFKRIAGESE